MRRLLIAFLLMATLTVQAQITYEFHDTPLTEALRTIEQSQKDYTIAILSDGLSDLRTTAKVQNLSAADAVRLVCKDLLVKVKVKRKMITVQYSNERYAQTEREITVEGKVEDAFLKVPLGQATVSICRPDSSVLADSLQLFMTYGAYNRPKAALYSAKVRTDADQLLVHASLKGYDDVWQQVSIVGKKKEVEVPTIGMLRMREITLGEVTVTATRVKMFYRGDTLVYDATAFKLPEGSMLDELIRQLPGVTMNDASEIFVNGRKVDELMLGSRSFFKGNRKVMLQNLPYYTVKDIKVYERQSDMSRALGYDVGDHTYVMDVNLKEEYYKGYIANVEGAVGTDDRWLARAFGLMFTDRSRYTVFANANNVNESRHIGEQDNWTPNRMPQSQLTTRSVAGEMNYHSKGDLVKNTLTANYTSTTDETESRSRYEQFLEGQTPTSLTELRNRNSNHRWQVHDEITFMKPFYIFTTADFHRNKRHGASSSMYDLWNDTLTVSQRSHSLDDGTAWGMSMDAQGAFNVVKEKSRMNFYVMGSHDEDESDAAHRFRTMQQAGPVTTTQHNTDDIATRYSWGIMNLNFMTKLYKKIEMRVSNGLQLNRTVSHDYLYHPDTLLLSSELDALEAITDIANSYHSRRTLTENTVGIALSDYGTYKMSPDLPYTVSYQRWDVSVSLPISHEALDYQRGMLDTLARQNTLFVNTSASFRQMFAGGRYELKLNASHHRSAPSLSDRITYRDDSQPLVVKLGNPDLKSHVTSKFGIDFSDKRGPKQQQWHIATSAELYHRQTAQSVTYNPVSGAYTYQPMNVKGAYRLAAKFDISRAIDEKRYWTWQTNADAGYHHSIDHAMLTGMTASEENIVNTLTLHDNAYLQYNKGALNVRAMGDIRLRHSEGKMYDFETLNATDFQYGLSARYTLPRLNTTLSADGNMYLRRGYGSSELNTDDFVLNASISQPFCKGKLIARIEAFDLLHQLSSTQYTVNAQGRTETWYRSLPHYVMAHLVYHWNKNPKKQ